MLPVFNAIKQWMNLPPNVNTEQNIEEAPKSDCVKFIDANIARIKADMERCARGEAPDKAAADAAWRAIDEFEGEENMERMAAGLPPLSRREQALERESRLREEREKKDWKKV
ncbi:MAG: hypothetical protein K2X08_04510 [Chlamydiales bacterium]|nr:hypothetical protein [Chlamydiales bacterium]